MRKQLAKGVGILKVAKSLGLGTGTVQRIAKELACLYSRPGNDLTHRFPLIAETLARLRPTGAVASGVGIW